MQMIPESLPLAVSLTLSLAVSGLYSQSSADGTDIVDLDLMETQSEYQFNDLQVELSRSDLNENLLRIYGSNQL